MVLYAWNSFLKKCVKSNKAVQYCKHNTLIVIIFRTLLLKLMFSNLLAPNTPLSSQIRNVSCLLIFDWISLRIIINNPEDGNFFSEVNQLFINAIANCILSF